MEGPGAKLTHGRASGEAVVAREVSFCKPMIKREKPDGPAGQEIAEHDSVDVLRWVDWHDGCAPRRAGHDDIRAVANGGWACHHGPNQACEGNGLDER